MSIYIYKISREWMKLHRVSDRTAAEYETDSNQCLFIIELQFGSVY